MSEKLPQQPQNEEVDLGQLFSAIGKLFDRLFAFIGRVLKGIFVAIIYILKPIVNNFKLIMIALVSAFVIGFIAEKYNKVVYSSEMIVIPHFDSKYQLMTDIKYFNSLIGTGKNKILADIFEIDSIRATELVGFEIDKGPENQNDLLSEYNDFMKTIDTLLVRVSYDEFIDNRHILSASVFAIKAKASTNDIFSNLEKGFYKTFENNFSKRKKALRDSILRNEVTTVNTEIVKIDSLQRIYLEVLRNESRNGNLSIGSGGLIPITQERSVTREYDLFEKEMKLRNTLLNINEVLIESSDYYEILSGFEDIGPKEIKYTDRYSLIFPVVTLALLLLVSLLIKAFKFIKNYE
ncbi:hypothetical protein [Winogradskyella ludwigii]|jgi:hypothetical protein|uniref:hypothetical protein n=1 Tax=Winogradskyella ludwigii TaxID=2686076 RepID=UPI0015CEB3B2|nr:hypothetical protein [Winogradskyella ludwigii]